MIDQKSVGRKISCINRFTIIHINNKLKPYKIGIGQLHFLMKLYSQDGINQETLAQDLKKDKATSARAIKKLEKQGYVFRKKDSLDNRSYKIYLTKKGIEIKPKIRKITLEWTNILTNGFDEKEKEILFSYLDRISDNAEFNK